MAETEACGGEKNLRVQSEESSFCNQRDIWRKIGLKLDRFSLYKLISSWKWFGEVVIADDTFWKKLIVRDLFVVVQELHLGDVSGKQTYEGIFKPPPAYNPLYNSEHPRAGARLGGVMMSSIAWIGAFDHALTADMLNEHGLLVSDLLPGLWVADAYTGICPYCEADCDKIKTMVSLWHSKLHLMDGFEEFCPETLRYRHTSARRGYIIDTSEESSALASLEVLSLTRVGLHLEDELSEHLDYKLSEQGLAFNFFEYESKIFDTEFRVTLDKGKRVVNIQILHMEYHFPI